MSSEPLLATNNLHAGYGAAIILHGVSLAVASGAITALIGGNGAGKTTLMRSICGLLNVRRGEIRFKGHDIAAAPAHERVTAGIAMVPEGRLVFPNMTVEENLRLGAISPRARAGAMKRLHEIYQQFPRLKERSAQRAVTLSGGEQQMLAIGRCLMSRPELILLDEPTLGLAPVMVKEVFAIIERLRRAGVTILVAEQNVRQTLQIADHAYVIENGRLVLSGAGTMIAGDAAIRKAYLGL